MQIAQQNTYYVAQLCVLWYGMRISISGYLNYPHTHLIDLS